MTNLLPTNFSIVKWYFRMFISLFVETIITVFSRKKMRSIGITLYIWQRETFPFYLPPSLLNSDLAWWLGLGLGCLGPMKITTKIGRFDAATLERMESLVSRALTSVGYNAGDMNGMVFCTLQYKTFALSLSFGTSFALIGVRTSLVTLPKRKCFKTSGTPCILVVRWAVWTTVLAPIWLAPFTFPSHTYRRNQFVHWWIENCFCLYRLQSFVGWIKSKCTFYFWNTPNCLYYLFRPRKWSIPRVGSYTLAQVNAGSMDYLHVAKFIIFIL